MRQFKWLWKPALFALVVLLVTVSGCKRAERQNPAARASEKIATKATSSQETAIPQTAPGGPSADELRQMVGDQQARSAEVQKQIAALGDAAKRNPEQLRRILLRRKGEILTAQKKIRLSDQLTPAQKDSLLQPLEAESINISKQMLAVSR